MLLAHVACSAKHVFGGVGFLEILLVNTQNMPPQAHLLHVHGGQNRNTFAAPCFLMGGTTIMFGGGGACVVCVHNSERSEAILTFS